MVTPPLTIPGGLLTAGVGAALGLGAKKDKINTIANVVNTKVGLLGLKTNLVRAGIEGAALVNNCEYDPRQQSF